MGSQEETRHLHLSVSLAGAALPWIPSHLQRSGAGLLHSAILVTHRVTGIQHLLPGTIQHLVAGRGGISRHGAAKRIAPMPIGRHMHRTSGMVPYSHQDRTTPFLVAQAGGHGSDPVQMIHSCLSGLSATSLLKKEGASMS